MLTLKCRGEERTTESVFTDGTQRFGVEFIPLPPSIHCKTHVKKAKWLQHSG